MNLQTSTVWPFVLINDISAVEQESASSFEGRIQRHIPIAAHAVIYPLFVGKRSVLLWARSWDMRFAGAEDMYEIHHENSIQVAIWSASSEEWLRNPREQRTSQALCDLRVICCPPALFLCSSAWFLRQTDRDGETSTAGIKQQFIRFLEDCRMRISETFRGIEYISARSTMKIERCSFWVWAVSWPAREMQRESYASIRGRLKVLYDGKKRRGRYRGTEAKRWVKRMGEMTRWLTSGWRGDKERDEEMR
ncbi:hypothetical protein BDZ97DRAFT_1760281 [Flammula alnicola]|nr:hypothetical protein BDZ97DRAFT_1760281 [Flammula alnicola]